MNNKQKMILLAAMLLLFSCARKKSAEVILNYMNPESSPNQLTIMQKICSRFEKLHPGVRINLITGVKTEKILSTIASGSGLDVFFGYESIAEFYERNAVDALDPYVEKFGFDKNEFFPVALDLVTYRHKLLALPVQLKTTCLAYNKTLLEQNGLSLPPRSWTWKDFEKYIAKIYQYQETKNSDGKKKYPIANIWFEEKLAVPDLFNEEQGKINPTAREKFIKKSGEQQKIFKYLPPPSEVAEMAGSGGASSFTSLFQMQVSYLQYAPAWCLINLLPIKDFEWDVIPSPYWEDNNLFHVNDAYLCLTSISRQKDITYKFMKFYVSQSGADAFARSKNGMSARSSSTRSFFTAPPASISEYVNILENQKLSDEKFRVKNFFQLRQQFKSLPESEELRTQKITPEKYTDAYYNLAGKIIEPFSKQ